MKTIRIIGVGSPSGDDRIGWLVAEAAERALIPSDGVRLESLALDRPGSDLVNRLAGADHVVIVDAVVSAGKPGTVEALRLDDLATDAPAFSAHALGVGAALRIAGTLGLLPPALDIVAVCSGGSAACSEPCPGVLAAVPAVLTRIVSATRPALALRFACCGRVD